MADWDLLLTDTSVASMDESTGDYGVVSDAALAIKDGFIAWLGHRWDLPDCDASETRSLGGRWVTPTLIDCHTHLVFGGNRAEEFEQRLKGASYEDIARAGGGIMSTVAATRKASDDELFESGLERLLALAAEGVAAVEIKSGYGLDVGNEIRILEVARRLGEATDITVRTTLLAAHAIPAEYADDPDRYVDLVCAELLPAAAERNLADAVDAYCETIAFRAPQIAKIFRTAHDLGLPVKLHADQLSDGGGAQLAAHFNAMSADHLEYASEAGVRALAKSGTTAVLLPGAFLTLNESQLPPIAMMRELGVPIALASDCNPGTSPICSVRNAMVLGARLFKLTPAECLAGVTRNAARALHLDHDRGTLETGKRADIAIWNLSHPRELCYWLGVPQLHAMLVAGRDFSPH
ncbi:MAG: imidazolonepropionase [Woeseiaceae bacterium]|nr:imidazolonepropionase [Woeseiaceae bacterium]